MQTNYYKASSFAFHFEAFHFILKFPEFTPFRLKLWVTPTSLAWLNHPLLPVIPSWSLAFHASCAMETHPFWSSETQKVMRRILFCWSPASSGSSSCIVCGPRTMLRFALSMVEKTDAWWLDLSRGDCFHVQIYIQRQRPKKCRNRMKLHEIAWQAWSENNTKDQVHPNSAKISRFAESAHSRNFCMSGPCIKEKR